MSEFTSYTLGRFKRKRPSDDVGAKFDEFVAPNCQTHPDAIFSMIAYSTTEMTSLKLLVSCGIPQGSCLGPLLFILFANDFEEYLANFAPNMYVDDTSITLGGEDAYQLLEDLRTELQDVILAKTKQVKPKCGEMRIHVLRKQ